MSIMHMKLWSPAWLHHCKYFKSYGLRL